MLAGRLWREPFFHHGRERIIRWERGRGLHPQGSYRLRPRLRWGGLLPRSGTRREVRRWLGRGMPGEDWIGPSRGGATLPGPLRGRDPEGGGDREPEGRLRGQDGETCRSMRKSHEDKRRLPPTSTIRRARGGGVLLSDLRPLLPLPEGIWGQPHRHL